jgi:hypothetical protein
MQQGNNEQQMNPIQAVAQNLDVQLQMHTGLAMQVGGLDADALKRGLVELLNSRAELIKSLRDALVTQQDEGMLVIAQLAASGSMAHIGALAEIISAARHMSTVSQAQERRIIS